jgi:hypothetical protein
MQKFTLKISKFNHVFLASKIKEEKIERIYSKASFQSPWIGD